MRNEEDFWLLNTLRLIDAVNKAAKINKQIEKLKIVNYQSTDSSHRDVIPFIDQRIP